MTVATTQARLRLRGCFQGVSGELDRFGEFRRYYDEYVARAEGRTPEHYGHQYWD